MMLTIVGYESSLLEEQLKKKLNEELKQEINKPNEIVQALIDRTLFIKFLEDNRIINSFFYEHFFNDKDLTYKKLLKEKNPKNINLLFEKIN
ncbi:MAG: hypothetical protein KKG06_01505, partial [Bacteroidetes bacterium]|nr:hypothetical protein [Bacteroidota bacterium]